MQEIQRRHEVELATLRAENVAISQEQMTKHSVLDVPGLSNLNKQMEGRDGIGGEHESK